MNINKLQPQDLQNYCFRYGTILGDLRNEKERDIYFSVKGYFINLTLELGEIVRHSISKEKPAVWEYYFKNNPYNELNK